LLNTADDRSRTASRQPSASSASRIFSAAT